MSRIALLIFGVLLACNIQATIVPTVLGNVDEQNPLILQLINSPAMQRLKHIDQSGPEAYYTANFPKLSRYDHSLGVYALLKRYNVSENEQIAGLLHDASHTVFSHLGDIVFQTGSTRDASYQDNIHDWFLANMQIPEILKPYKIALTDISPKNPEFKALEQPYPDMNADRIEYNLHTALVFKNLDQDDVDKILASLKYKDNKWYFSDVINAKKFATLSTYYTKAFWGNAHNVALYTVASAAIKYALKHKIITKDDMHFGIDEKIVEKLNRSNNPQIKKLVQLMHNIDNYYIITDANNYDVYQPIKMRGIDPLVQHDGKLVRLSALSTDFRNDLKLTQEYSKNGVYIKFTVADQKLLKLLQTANI